MKPCVCRLFFARADELRDRDGSAGGKSGEKSDDKGYDLSGGSAHARQCLFPYELPHDHTVDRVVELLKKSPEQDREKEQEKLFPDHAFCDFIFCLLHGFHEKSPYLFLLITCWHMYYKRSLNKEQYDMH